MRVAKLALTGVFVLAMVQGVWAAQRVTEELTVLGRTITSEEVVDHCSPAKVAGTTSLEVRFTPGVRLIAVLPPGPEIPWENLKFRPIDVARFWVQPGVYDIVAYWGRAGLAPGLAAIVVHEDVEVENDMSVTLDREEAAYRFELQPFAVDGSHLESPGAKARFMFSRKDVPVPLVELSAGIAWGGGDALGLMKTMWFSGISDNYLVEVQLAAQDPTTELSHSMYFFGGQAADGISEDVIVEVSPEVWQPVVFEHNPPVSTESLVFSWSLTNSPIGDPSKESVGKFTVGCQGPQVPLFEPFEQKVYVQPTLEDRLLGFLRMYAHSHGTLCIDFSPALYESGYLKFDNGLKAYVAGNDELPIFESDELRYPVGLGAMMWYGRMENTASELKIVPARGRYLLPFIGQTGSFPNTAAYTLQAEHLEGGAVVSTFNVVLPGYTTWPVIDEVVIEPSGSAYELRLSYSDRQYSGTPQRHAWVELAGDVTRQDPDPPYLRRMMVREGDRVVDHLTPGAGSIELIAMDDGSGVASVRAGYLVDGVETHLLADPTGDDTWQIEIPANAEADGLGTLWIEVSDASGNSMKLHSVLPVTHRVNLPVHHQQLALQ